MIFWLSASRESKIYFPISLIMTKSKYSAQFMLTDLEHGFDAPHLETSAVMQPDGSFVIHTPNPGAAKCVTTPSTNSGISYSFPWYRFMPPTLPYGGVPRVGLVFAKLLVHGDDHGIRPFIVPLNDGSSMCKGITAKSVLRPSVSNRLLTEY